jgi:rsbT co-antagonist protein RsbR
MQHVFSWMMTIESRDEDLCRRGRNVVLLALGSMCMALLALVALLLLGNNSANLLLIGLMLLVYVGVLGLVRRGRVALGSLILIASIAVATVVGALVNHTLSVAPFYLIMPVLIASLCLQPSQIWPVAAAMLAALGLMILGLPSNPLNDPLGAQVVMGSFLLLGIVTLMSLLGANSTNAALRAELQARQAAEAAVLALQNTNTDLEALVHERTAALQTRADEQAHLLAEIEQQRNTIHELSVPVIPISLDTLVMPLVGALDSARLQEIQTQALHALEHSSARHLVLDITGVALVDTQVAQGLLRVVQAVQLLGAEGLLVGIRPEVAQAIIGLGLNLQSIYTARDLQTALAHIALNTSQPSVYASRKPFTAIKN